MTVLPDEEISPAAPFPDATREQWRQLVAGVLRKSGREVSGAEAEAALATALDGGVTVQPLYTAEDTAPDPGLPGFPPYVRGSSLLGGWDVRQRLDLADPAAANEAALDDLENGATSLWLAAGGPGLPVGGLERALDGVLFDLAPVVLDAGPDTGAAGRELLRLYEASGADPRAVRGCLGADPLGLAARTGRPAGY
ncbi:MAG: methylmalonyl-CoA mutase, partial [Streptomyces sp.]|nr:methylmalonyl-CoA mutase [Streptomyces sp.]